MLIKSGLPCQDCGSSDALSVYENGDYCFSCSKWTRLDSNNVVDFKLKDKTPVKGPVVMPNSIPVENGSLVDCFLKARHFTDEQMFYYNLRQSSCGNYLVLSEAWGNHYKYVEVRNVNPKLSVPKYLTVGDKKDAFYGRETVRNDIFIIVEDILSAMRVGWSYPCCALRGTKLNEKMLSKFCLLKKPITIVTWFDNDNPGQAGAFELHSKLSWCGFDFKNINTEKDPKWYTDDQIWEILSGV